MNGMKAVELLHGAITRNAEERSRTGAHPCAAATMGRTSPSSSGSVLRRRRMIFCGRKALRRNPPLGRKAGQKTEKRWWSEDQGTRRRQPKCQRTVGFGPPKTPKPERKAVNCVRPRRRPFTKAVEVLPHAVRRRSGGCDCDRAATTPSSPSNTADRRGVPDPLHWTLTFCELQTWLQRDFRRTPKLWNTDVGKLSTAHFRKLSAERGSNQKILDNCLPFGEV